MNRIWSREAVWLLRAPFAGSLPAAQAALVAACVLANLAQVRRKATLARRQCSFPGSDVVAGRSNIHQEASSIPDQAAVHWHTLFHHAALLTPMLPVASQKGWCR